MRLRAPLVALAASLTVVLLTAAPRAEAQIIAADLSKPVTDTTFYEPRIPLKGTFKVDAGTKKLDVYVRREVAGAQSAAFRISLDSNGDFDVVTSPDFAYNGRYRVDAVFSNDDNRQPVLGGCNPNPCTRTITHTAFLAAPPAPPTELRAAVDPKNRTVTLSWAAAPEPDILGWAIRRSVNGGAPGAENSVLASKTPTWVDTALPDTGGKLDYFVTAVRRGATDQSSVRSATPATSSVTVEARPITAPTTAPPPGGTTTTLSPFGSVVTAPPSAAAPPRPKVPGSVGIGAFAKGLNPGASRSTLEDGTYEENLPYGPGNGDDPEVGPDQAQGVFAPDSGDSGVPALFYVAAAVMASVVAAHVLFILKQVRQGDPIFEALPVVAVPVDEERILVIPPARSGVLREGSP